MKETRNITLALPVALLKQAKRVAADRDTSVSALLEEALKAAVRPDADQRYEAARRRYVARRQTSDLGTKGRRTWTRDSLHER